MSCFKTLLFPAVLLWNLSDIFYCWCTWWATLL